MNSAGGFCPVLDEDGVVADCLLLAVADGVEMAIRLTL